MSSHCTAAPSDTPVCEQSGTTSFSSYKGPSSADDIQMSKCTSEIQINAEEQAERSGDVAQLIKRIFCSG